MPCCFMLFHYLGYLGIIVPTHKIQAYPSPYGVHKNIHWLWKIMWQQYIHLIYTVLYHYIIVLCPCIIVTSYIHACICIYIYYIHITNHYYYIYIHYSYIKIFQIFSNCCRLAIRQVCRGVLLPEIRLF